MKIRLADIAYARSGDKGAHANIGVWVHNDEAYEFLRSSLTAEVVREHFASLRPESVERYELANIRAFNFVLQGVLGAGGASSGLRTDAQAKTYSARILRVELNAPEGGLPS
ncbi:MAG TPA: hypothetical protein VM282_08605 [Acidimicrobiales bacterium]|nr:hypothetical protein [Acidimicrobiales bacterium]